MNGHRQQTHAYTRVHQVCISQFYFGYVIFLFCLLFFCFCFFRIVVSGALVTGPRCTAGSAGGAAFQRGARCGSSHYRDTPVVAVVVVRGKPTTK